MTDTNPEVRAAKISVSHPSYCTGETVVVKVELDEDAGSFPDGAFLNLSFTRVMRERNLNGIGFSHNLELEESAFTIRRDIPGRFEKGLYMVSGLRIIPPYEAPESKKIHFKPTDDSQIFFWVAGSPESHVSKESLTARIHQVNHERHQFNKAPRYTPAAKNANATIRYRVQVFSVGCLIHSPQNLEGYSISPLKGGFDYVHMLEAVNRFYTMSNEKPVDHIPKTSDSFKRSTPLFVVEFANVHAVDVPDAGTFCTFEAETFYTLMAFENDQKPRSFATVVTDLATGERKHAFHFPGYGGNLAAGFNSSAIALSIETNLPRMDKTPWLKLIVQNFVDANSETDPNFACFKLWAVFEVAATRTITSKNVELSDPRGEPILYYGGERVTTGKPLGKVYAYLQSLNISQHNFSAEGRKIIFETSTDSYSSPNYDDETLVITLWELLSALYEVRNQTAHAGSFNVEQSEDGSQRAQLAARLYKLPYGQLSSQAASFAKHAIKHELEAAED